MSDKVTEIRTPFHQFEVGFSIIIDLITPGTRVLDLGCGSARSFNGFGMRKTWKDAEWN